jgi:hypothetical protein
MGSLRALREVFGTTSCPVRRPAAVNRVCHRGRLSARMVCGRSVPSTCTAAAAASSGSGVARRASIMNGDPASSDAAG